jgi:hypothetical protein
MTYGQLGSGILAHAEPILQVSMNLNAEAKFFTSLLDWDCEKASFLTIFGDELASELPET